MYLIILMTGKGSLLTFFKQTTFLDTQMLKMTIIIDHFSKCYKPKLKI